MAKKPSGPPKSKRPRPTRAIADTPAKPKPPAHAVTGKGAKVRAIEKLFYGDKRRRVGDVFTITDPSHFSKRSMEYVDAKTPERTTRSKTALAQKNAEVVGHAVEGGQADEELL
jgi:hypothetical protein